MNNIMSFCYLYALLAPLAFYLQYKMTKANIGQENKKNVAILLSYSSDIQLIKTSVIALCDGPDVLDQGKCTNL